MSKEEKKSHGAGKFFLGAALGAAVGAIASRFLSVEKESACDCEDCDCDDCACDHCACETPEPKEVKKPTTKHATKK